MEVLASNYALITVASVNPEYTPIVGIERAFEVGHDLGL